jgi:dTDP-4-dehydrorhamnose 3,5-epimerase
MKVNKQSIEGVYVIEPAPFFDDRGVFRRNFCKEVFASCNVETAVAQANISENKKAFTLRGFHYQIDPNGEAKTLSCLRGKIYDIVVDLRPESKTFKKWVSFELSESNRLSLHVPVGCANAFLTLEDNSLIHYYCSYPYTPEAEKGIRYNDPLFQFIWPHKPVFISEKDLNHPDFYI